MDRIIFKRDQSQQKFNPQKITDAVSYAMVASEEGDIEAAKKITENVVEKLDVKTQSNPRYMPNVEEIQDMVENELMLTNFLKTAKAYILYRNKQAVKRERNIFAKRMNLKPYEYPELYEYVPARKKQIVGFIEHLISPVLYKISRPSLPKESEVQLRMLC